MKSKYILSSLLLMLMLVVSSCKVGSYTQTVGEPNEAYLVFVSNHKYSDKVQVTLDGKTSFDAEVIKEKKGTVKGNIYGIATGTRDVKVTQDGKVLYQAKIFVSQQETKKILLP